MLTILFYVLPGLGLFGSGWFISAYIQKTKFNALMKALEQKHKTHEQKLFDEQTVIADNFFKANVLDLEEKSQKLNLAFLENGRTVELISAELKSAQTVVDDVFATLPDIYNCSQKTNNATQKSREKIDELSNSVESWQGSMLTLQNIENLIDAIHNKAIQIRDISSEANLLALNASIEAARAGEHGRGFAVVATSMRELSNKSSEATVDINSALEKTRIEVEKIINGITESVELLIEVSEAVKNRFANIEVEVNNIENISQTSLKDADRSKEQFIAINTQVNDQLENITRLLADTLGEVTGSHITNISVSADFAGMKIIDVRRPDEFNGELGHIDNAELISLNDADFEGRLQRLDKTKPHLFVCRSGGRSARAARIALGHGFKAIYNMQGGMQEYRKMHGPAG